MRMIVFRAIATGVYESPPELAAQIAVGTIRSTATDVVPVRLVAVDTATRDLLQTALAG
jgi:O-acetyl-ADP-ribose deacetylase